MMFRLLFVTVLLFTSVNLFSQEIELNGELKPGNVIIGKAVGGERVLLNDKTLPISEEGLFVFGFDTTHRCNFPLKYY